MSDKTVDSISMVGGWVFVLPIEDKDTYGNIIVPDTAKEVTQKGTVVAVAETKNIKRGDVILFRRRATFKTIELDGVMHNVMQKAEILGVMFGENAWDVAALNTNVFLEWEQALAFYPGTDFIKPDAFRQMHFTGTILAAGPDCTEVATGDRVFFDQFAGVERFMDAGRRFAFVRQDDIYCRNLPKRTEVTA